MDTFPYTPGFVHGERVQAFVATFRFLDFTEQRYRMQPDLQRRFTYEFTSPSSSLVAGIASFYLQHGGPRDTFTAIDHRTGTPYTVRFASTLDHLRGPHVLRAVRIDFVTDADGTAIVPVSYGAAIVPDFCEALLGDGVVTPQSGDAHGLGFTVMSQWLVTGVVRGSVLAEKRFVAETPWAWAMPFMVPRSGTSVDKMGVLVTQGGTNSGFAFLGIYTAGSGGADVLPSSRLVAPGSVWLTSTGLKVYSFAPVQFASKTLYYGAIATRHFSGFGDYVRGAGITTDAAQLFPLGYSTSHEAILGWVTASIATLPETWPTSATPYGDVTNGVPVLHFQVCS